MKFIFNAENYLVFVNTENHSLIFVVNIEKDIHINIIRQYRNNQISNPQYSRSSSTQKGGLKLRPLLSELQKNHR